MTRNQAGKRWLTVSVIALTLQLGGCSTESTRGAATGAASGAAIGAVGGVVTALVFGGSVSDAAAMGAVWGGSTGAVSGGVQGAQAADRKRTAEEQQIADRLAKLRKQVGDDTYQGLEALADCKLPVAEAYAKTAQKDSNPDYALAGYWLEVLTLSEQGRIDDAEAMLPELVSKDNKVVDVATARSRLATATDQMAAIRERTGSAPKCS